MIPTPTTRGAAEGSGVIAPPASARIFAPRFRDFEVAIRGQESDHYGGFAITLDDVIERQLARFRRELAVAMTPGGDVPESFEEDFGDRIIYDRGRVVAILRPTPEGSFEVARFDRVDVWRKDGGR